MKPRVQNLEQPAALIDIALDREGVLFAVRRGDALEVHRLAHHRADAAHLKHQPLQRFRPRLGVRRQETAVFFGEIPKDRAGFEHGEVAVRPVDDGRNAPVRIELQIVGRFLFALGEIDEDEVVGNLRLLKEDHRLVPVHRRGGVEPDVRAAHAAVSATGGSAARRCASNRLKSSSIVGFFMTS